MMSLLMRQGVERAAPQEQPDGFASRSGRNDSAKHQFFVRAYGAHPLQRSAIGDTQVSKVAY